MENRYLRQSLEDRVEELERSRSNDSNNSPKINFRLRNLEMAKTSNQKHR